ncbi:hypothetical protein N7470_000107 [Penicillium chermesinum]|nr:hypothetical protein N7470_000107 [Penicillium chermesinum]
MSQASFRLETFRPWNPFQDKAQPLQDSLDFCRYPSPVSITTTPPPSVSDITSKGHSHNARHPLPPRPPVEVCLDGDLQTDLQTSSLKPGSPKLPVTTDLHPQILHCEDVTQPHGIYSGENIDPAIIEDSGRTGTDQIQVSERIAGLKVGQKFAFGKGDRTSGFHPAENESSSLSQHSAQPGTAQSDELSIDIPKRLGSRWKHDTKVSRRTSTTTSSHCKHPPFSIVRSQFMGMTVEDRLQFLSWLFEGALSNCASIPLFTDAASTVSCGHDGAADIAYPGMTRI